MNKIKQNEKVFKMIEEAEKKEKLHYEQLKRKKVLDDEESYMYAYYAAIYGD